MKKRISFILPALALFVVAGCVSDLQYEDPVKAPVTHHYYLSLDSSTKTAFDDSSEGKRRPTWVNGDKIHYFTASNVLGSTGIRLDNSCGYIDLTFDDPSEDLYLNAFYSGQANEDGVTNPIRTNSLSEFSFNVNGVAKSKQSYLSFSEAHACAAHLFDLEDPNIHFHSIVSIFRFVPDQPSVTKVVFSSRTPNQIINGGTYGQVTLEMDEDGNLVSVYPYGTGSYGGTSSITISTANMTVDNVVYFSVIPTYFKDGFKLQCYEGDTVVKEVEYTNPIVAGEKEDGSLYPSIIGLGRMSQWKTGEELPATVYVEDLVLSEDTIGADGSFYPGDEVNITATVLPSDAYNTTLSWSLTEGEGVVEYAQIAGDTQDANVVTIKITALQAGTAKLKFSTIGTAESGQPIEKTCVITVTNKPDPGALDGIADLSAQYGTANCYIATAIDSVFRFPANVKGNSTEAISPAYATVLWETHNKLSSTDSSTILPGDVIETVSYNQGYIVFKAISAGNALIAAHSSDGTILWSWHIWVWPGYDEDSNSQVYIRDAGTMMDRNLGAMNSFPTGIYDWSTFGLMYQWGRKDPFFGRETSVLALNPDYDGVPAPEYSDLEKGNVPYTVKNPMTFLLYPENNAQDWMYPKRDNTLWGDEKTMYDPCPPGWKVPGKTFWVKNLGSTSMLSYSALSDLYPGLDFTGIMARGYQHVFYPVQGAWLGTAEYSYPKIVYGKTYYGYYWTSGVNTSNNGGVVMSINRTGKTLNPNASDARACGFSVRCMKDPSAVSNTDPGGNEGGGGDDPGEGGGGEVTPDPIRVTKITVSPDQKTIFKGNTVHLSYTIEPSNADSTRVVWSSSDDSIATVDANGLVKGIEVGGPVFILATATDDSNKSGVCVLYVEEQTSVNLSADGYANCYIVSSANNYCFKPVRGNSTSASDVLTPSRAALLWESYCNNSTITADIIKDVEYSDGYIYFNVPADKMMNGNAVIAAYDSQDNIIWSWHIWVCKNFNAEGSAQVYVEHQPEYERDPDTGDQVLKRDNNGRIILNATDKVVATVMDRNLGALSATPGDVGALGLMYQWGRKDPFVGSAVRNYANLSGGQPFAVVYPSGMSKTNSAQTIAYTIAHPNTFICIANQNWLNVSDNTLWSEGAKTIYDPCPPGWKVPKGGNDGLWAKACGLGADAEEPNINTDTTYGVNYSIFTAPGTTVWTPYAGYIQARSGTLNGVAGQLALWSASVHSDAYKAYALFQSSSALVTVAAPTSKAQGCSVRCVKE